MDFIFMLTRNDATVGNCFELLEFARQLGLRHIGFKDVGAPEPTLRRLNEAIRAAGAQTYMEIVSTTREAELNSVRLARDLGVDRLLGGTLVDDALDILAGSRTRYLPFPGLPAGHPTQLGGSPDLVESQCRGFAQKGCAGVDILAYRATEADPLDLIRACRRGLGPDGVLIVAGSVSSPERISAVRSAGANAFTIGTAVIDGCYAPRDPSIVAQLEAVLADCRNSP
jgi:hypothetical protein